MAQAVSFHDQHLVTWREQEHAVFQNMWLCHKHFKGWASIKRLEIPPYGLEKFLSDIQRKKQKNLEQVEHIIQSFTFYINFILFYLHLYITLQRIDDNWSYNTVMWPTPQLRKQSSYMECNMIQTKWQTSTHPSTWQFWHGNVQWICLKLRCGLQQVKCTLYGMERHSCQTSLSPQGCGMPVGCLHVVARSLL
jgi:hypothetical protein